MRSRWLGIIILVLITGWFIGAKSTKLTTLSSIPDISWPNCTLSIPHSYLGIVGIDGGLALRPNPCLAKEAGDFNRLSVYVNTGYPGIARALKFQDNPRRCSAADQHCLAYNYGFNSGLYDINYSLRQGVIAKQWWLDVETDNSWSTNPRVNRQALQGTLDALSKYAGADNIGFYSEMSQWQAIVGQWNNKYQVWLATGSRQESDALAACKDKSFTGGSVSLTQYTPSLDANYICK